MSQLITNLSGANTASGIAIPANGKGDAAQGGGTTFDQTLIAMLFGNVSSAEGGARLQSLGLLGLTNSDEQGTADEELQALQAMVDNLLEQLNELDQALAENPSLLLVLQAWLQGAQMVTQPVDGGSVIEPDPEAAPIPVLAQHPETVRFAVQDALVQLKAVSEQQNAAFPTVIQSRQLIEVLQQMLGSSQTSNPAVAQGTEGHTANNWISALEKNILAIMNVTSNQTARNGVSQNFQLPASHVATANVAGKNNAQNASLMNAALSAESAPAAEAADDVSHGMHAGNVVTAGQLAMRDALTAPAKPAAPAVPVEQFGKEMGGFLVSKLEIVKLQGMSQARISLYPEHLGQVDVKITMQNGQLVAQFMTEHAFARESLESQMAQLRSALQAQGLQVSKLEVTQNSSLSSHMYQDGRQQNGGTNQQQSNKRREVREEDLLTLGDLNDEWNEWISEVRARDENFGSSFVARV
ncbi:flagellar hook-length control protein FliK [Paenibacillus ihumii]|uniref:flagellar hook-length control protein FliK n=1 Tax=Paenibacillus ihumii TaxID=687436 RepID=UPI0006D7744A|nr:flagellar hook-length control protein FliK [Paenibacillus ihumii]